MVDIQTLCRCACVCRSWKHITEDPELRNRVDFSSIRHLYVCLTFFCTASPLTCQTLHSLFSLPLLPSSPLPSPPPPSPPRPSPPHQCEGQSPQEIATEVSASHWSPQPPWVLSTHRRQHQSYQYDSSLSSFSPFLSLPPSFSSSLPLHMYFPSCTGQCQNLQDLNLSECQGLSVSRHQSFLSHL